MNDLKLGKSYNINSFQIVKTKFRNKPRVTLRNSVLIHLISEYKNICIKYIYVIIVIILTYLLFINFDYYFFKIY